MILFFSKYSVSLSLMFDDGQCVNIDGNAIAYMLRLNLAGKYTVNSLSKRNTLMLFALNEIS